MTLDAITVFESLSGPANKIVSREPDGSITKRMAPHSGRFIARTVSVPDVHALAAVLREVGEHPDQVISLSVFKDAPAGEFVVMPAKELAARLRVAEHNREALDGFHEIDGAPTAVRIKQSMKVSNWLLFDRDLVDGMPASLAALSFDEWREAVDLLFPGFAAAGCVVVPSTSTRVTINDVPLTSNSYHVFVKIDNPFDLPRAWGQAALRALITEYRGVPLGFAKRKRDRMTHEIVATDWWTIWDKSVAAVARLVFDGAPVVRDNGLAVLPPVIEICDGPTLETVKMKDLAPRKEKGALEDVLEQIRGIRPTINLTKSQTGRVTGIEIVTADLTVDLTLETERGPMTVGELQEAGGGHVRCQAPFRESTSWAAFYNVHRDGSPFVFDSGTGEKHVLQRESLRDTWEIIHGWMIKKYRPSLSGSDRRIFSETQGWMTVRQVQRDPEIIRLMRGARNTPLTTKGRISENALPSEFNKWMDVAWGELLRTLPTEDEVGAISGPAAEGFCEHVATLLTTMYRMSLHGGESRSFGTWAYVFAILRPGEWVWVGGLDLWARILDDGLQIAFKPTLATQTQRTFPEIGNLSLNQLTRRCRKYGIAADGDNRIYCDGREIRAAILAAEFVASLNLPYDLSDPLAAALRARLAPEPNETRPSRPRSGREGKH